MRDLSQWVTHVYRSQKNLQKIPATIIERIREFDQDDVVAATVQLVLPKDIEQYEKLGISLVGEELVLPEAGAPDPNAGRYSHANLFGMEKIRKDLPKYKKEFGFWAPSWGSGSYHYVAHEREVYPRDFYPPKEVDLSITSVGKRGEGFLLKFSIDQVINRRTPKFEQELLYNLNLLQENVGSADIFASSTSLAEFAASVRVNWQILPPGDIDDVVAAMLQGKRPISAQQREVMQERVTAMSRLRPEAYITGTDGFLRYFGAKFGDDFVAFENVRYGNALYILYDNWEDLSQKSRIEILAGDPDSFERIEHREGWIEQLRARVGRYRLRNRREGKLL